MAPAVKAGAHTLFTMKDGMGRLADDRGVMTARKAFLAEHRAALDDFSPVDDLVRGIHWMLDPAHREEAIAFVAKLAAQPASQFEPYYLTTEDEYHDPNGRPDLAALQANIDSEVKYGFLPHSIDVKKYADLDFIDRATKRFASETAAKTRTASSRQPASAFFGKPGLDQRLVGDVAFVGGNL